MWFLVTDSYFVHFHDHLSNINVVSITDLIGLFSIDTKSGTAYIPDALPTTKAIAAKCYS